MVIRSIREFRNGDELVSSITKAKIEAHERAKIKIAQFLRTTPLIPRETGELIESGIRNLFSLSCFDEIDLNILFDVPYAQKINQQTNFINKIQEPIKTIILTEIESAFRRNGIQVDISND